MVWRNAAISRNSSASDWPNVQKSAHPTHVLYEAHQETGAPPLLLLFRHAWSGCCERREPFPQLTSRVFRTGQACGAAPAVAMGGSFTLQPVNDPGLGDRLGFLSLARSFSGSLDFSQISSIDDHFGDADEAAPR